MSEAAVRQEMPWRLIAAGAVLAGVAILGACDDEGYNPDAVMIGAAGQPAAVGLSGDPTAYESGGITLPPAVAPEVAGV